MAATAPIGESDREVAAGESDVFDDAGACRRRSANGCANER